jgi:class 3 adenylate cyclase
MATLERAREALDRREWTQAYEGLAAVAAADELSGEDLQRLAEAAWWSAHPRESLDAFERAFAAYLREEQPVRAAAVALRLANDHAESMDPGLWNGWVRRAASLLEGQPESEAHGWLALEQIRGFAMFGRGSPEEARELASRIGEIGGRLQNPDLRAFGLAFQGMVLVLQGQVEQGLSLVDEAAVAAIGGELTPFGAGNIYCITISVCRSAADYRRAGEWTEAATRWCERQAVTGFPGVCRVHRAEILRLRGDLSGAEAEARSALDVLMTFGMRRSMGWAYLEIGEIRARLGDLPGAEEAFDQAHQLGVEPQPGLALLHLARGRVEAARASIATALADAVDVMDRARLLPARVEIALAAHDVAEAREAADELREIAATFDKPVLHAGAHQALGAALTFEEDAAAAIAELRRAVRHWTEAGAPLEAAQARRWLAVAYRSGADEASALLELRAAAATFERLGARLEADRCEEMIRAGERSEAGRRVTRTFMFTDVVGSTDLIQTIGDAAWENVLRWHDVTLRKLIASNGGRVVNATGDGFFAAFGDPAAAAGCAVAIQRRLAEHRRKHGFAPAVRIGLHAAEATELGDTFAGLGVHAAARVGALAEGGEIAVSASTVDGAAVPFEIGNEREVALKGIADPVRVLSIDWRGAPDPPD